MKIQLLYILGSTRSGTSALRNAISETRYAGYGEGHLVPMLQGLISVVRHHKHEGVGCDTSGNGLFLMKEHVMIRHLVHAYEMYLRESIGVSTILDKTPTVDPISAAPDLNNFHEAPRFIHCSRRHIDNILSKQKKFPDASFVKQCTEWARCNSAWMDSKTKLSGNYVDFDYFDLVNDTRETCKRIGTYLELDNQEIDAMVNYLVSKRPEGAPGRDLTRFKKLSETPWSDEQREQFQAICGEVGEQLGYGMEEYFA